MIEEEFFHTAIDLPASERAAYLRAACGDDTALRDRVEKLIATHEKNEPLFGKFGDDLLGSKGKQLQAEREALDILSTGNVLEVKLTGKLTKHAYLTFAPEVTRLIQERGKLRILFQIHEFHGWTAGAIWEDIKFDFEHWRDIDRLAIVGEAKWEEGMANFCKPFLKASVRYFDHNTLEEARIWINEA